MMLNLHVLRSRSPSCGGQAQFIGAPGTYLRLAVLCATLPSANAARHTSKRGLALLAFQRGQIGLLPPVSENESASLLPEPNLFANQCSAICTVLARMWDKMANLIALCMVPEAVSA